MTRPTRPRSSWPRSRGSCDAAERKAPRATDRSGDQAQVRRAAVTARRRRRRRGRASRTVRVCPALISRSNLFPPEVATSYERFLMSIARRQRGANLLHGSIAEPPHRRHDLRLQLTGDRRDVRHLGQYPPASGSGSPGSAAFLQRGTRGRRPRVRESGARAPAGVGRETCLRRVGVAPKSSWRRHL